MYTKYPLLNSMIQDMNQQSDLYKPTTFWEQGSKLIIDDLEKNDIKDFRKLSVTKSFFVPNYTPNEYLKEPYKYDNVLKEFDSITIDKRFVTKINRVFCGYESGFSDYRVLEASNIDKKPYTNKISESSVGNPLEQFTFNNRKFSRSFLNYLLGLNFLKKHLDTTAIQTVMEIGGGFGTLGEILLGDERNNIFYINADIPPVSFVSSYYLEEVFGKEKIANYDDLKDLSTLDIKTLKNQYQALNLCSWQIPKLVGSIDLFVNFISFQEMEPDVVQNYCNHVDRLQPKFILLRNMLEGKRKQSENFKAGVKDPILGNDYDRFLPNYELVTTDSEVYGFVTEDNFHSQLRIYKRKES